MSMKLGGCLILGLLVGSAPGATNPWVGELPASFKSGAKVPALEETGPRARLVAGDWSRFEQAFAESQREYFIWDGTHPTIAGHALIAEAWLETVK